MIAAAATEGGTCGRCDTKHLDSVIAKLREVGNEVEVGPDWVELKETAGYLRRMLKPSYPGFPTDSDQ